LRNLSHDPTSRLFTFPSDDGIVVVEVGKDAAMEVADVAPALRERLGPEATVGLLALFETARQDWTADVTTAAVERFERRLTDEMSGMRVALAQTEAALRQQVLEGDASLRREMSALAAALRQEINDQGIALRQEINDQGIALRQEIHDQGVVLRQEIHDQGVVLRHEICNQGVALRHEISSLRQEHLDSRFDLVKWSFVFWVGQVIAIAGVVGLMLRLTSSAGG
jgi:hypothetical protein